RPSERASRAVRPAELKAAVRDVGAIPQLLGQRKTLSGEAFERAHQLCRGQPHRKEMPRALAGQDRPCTPAPGAIPRRAIVVLSVLVANVTTPARARGQADLERRVHALKAAQHAVVLRAAQAVADQLEKFGSDRSLCRSLIRVRSEAHVLARGE